MLVAQTKLLPDTRSQRITIWPVWPDVITDGRRGHEVSECYVAGNPEWERIAAALGLERGYSMARYSGRVENWIWWERDGDPWRREYTYERSLTEHIGS